MARRPPATPAGLRTAAIAMAAGALTIGIVVPVLLASLKITTMEIAPGVDLLLILLPLVGIVDLILARVFWQRAKAMDTGGSDPVVG
jgi:hypothetical protein